MRYRQNFSGHHMGCGCGPWMGHERFMEYGPGRRSHRGARWGGPPWMYGPWIDDEPESEDLQAYVSDLESVVSGLQDEIRDLKSRLDK